ncbi:SurA N-terminal domain-containing protein [Zestomonas thermotolerans]|uniref:SurA N-terminal domain-containing protein n=1 Tax=Zestomonas thermotolerans TaxID=157784 RepID=UPI00047F8671|nr:SurA N-terminal domain-containing protein [Pseudomonas thermotolerans]
MLQNIRDNSQGWIAKTIIGVIVVLLALTGFDAIINTVNNTQVAAEVNGEEITQNELSQAVDMQRRQLIQRLGKDFDVSRLDDKLLREAALKGLIERKLLLQSANDADFVFSQQALDQVILQTPEFQVNGQFSVDKYDQVIRQMGYTRLQFRQMLEQEMLIAQLRAGIAGSGFVTDEEVRSFARLERQTRDFASLTVKADKAHAEVSDEEVKAYYDEHSAQYMSPEQVVIEYVELKKDAFFDKVEVSNEELQALYQREIANLAEQRNAAHILVGVNDKVDEAQAKAKIEEIRKQLDEGKDFAALAKEFSEDPGSADNGGELGFAGPGVYDSEFETALYALKKGEVSQPVRSEYGWHLIKLLDVQAPEVPSFDSLKDKLVRELKAQQVEQRFVEASKALEDAAFEASDLAQPAQELGLQVQISAPFGREGGEGVTANNQVIQAAYSPEVLEDGANSNLLELDPDTAVVLRVKEHRKPEQLPFEQVAASIREQLVEKRAAEQARSEGEKLLAGLREDKTPVEQAAGGQTWQQIEAATRSQEGVEPVVLQTLFRMPRPVDGKPTFAGVALANGDYVILQLKGVSEPDDELAEDEREMYRQFLASRSGQQDFSAFRRELERSAEIERK